MSCVLGAACAPTEAPQVESVNLSLEVENGLTFNGTSFRSSPIRAVATDILNGLATAFPSFPIWPSQLFDPNNIDPYSGVGPNGGSYGGANVTQVSLEGQPVDSLVGVQLEGETVNGQPTLIEVTGVATGSGANTDLIYYVVHASEGPDWVPLCGTGGSGEPIPALAVPGAWDHRSGIVDGGLWRSDGQTFSFACRGSSVAKCMEAGYRPWVDPSSKPGDIKVRGAGYMNAPNHLQACVRMLRGDYCGDGTAHTINGRLVEFWDTLGLHRRTRPDFSFEAAWNEHGATALDLPRVLRAEGLPSCAYGAARGSDDMKFPNGAKLEALNGAGHRIFSSYAKQLVVGQPSTQIAVSTEPSRLELQSGTCLDVVEDDGLTVQPGTCSEEPGQAFRLIPRASRYELRHDATGQCLGARAGESDEGLPLLECFRDKTQLWTVEEASATGAFILRNRATGTCLDVSEGEDTHLSSCNPSSPTQHIGQHLLPNERGLDLSAASARLHGDFKRVDDYILVERNGEPCRHRISSHRAEFNFEVTQPGNYQIEGEVRGSNGNDNSFFVRVDGAPSRGYLWDTSFGRDFRWNRVRPRGADDNVSVFLEAGHHTVTIYEREDGTQLRRLRLVLTE